MKRIVFCASLIALVAAGCSQKPAANTASSSPTPKPAASTASSSPKTEKKVSTNPVPADWVRLHDDAKGYEFQVPQGTKDAQDTKDGVDVYMANVPAPYDIGVMVVAFKDKTLSKEDLIKKAEDILKAFEEKDIKIEPAKELSDDYSLCTFTSTGKDGKPGKG